MKCKNLKLKIKLVYDEDVHSYTILNKELNCGSDFTHLLDVEICTSPVTRYFIVKSFKGRNRFSRPFFIPIPVPLDCCYNSADIDHALSALSFYPYSPLVHELLDLIHTYILTL